MTDKIRIDQFLDDTGKLIQFPRKHKTMLSALEYLAEKFELGVTYSEQQVNEICNQWHTFGDFFLLRRALIDNGFLDRKQDGSLYWRIWEKAMNDDEITT